MDKNFIKDRVYYIRNNHKISARNLSLELGMSSEYINQLESGRLTPSIEFLISFCEYFDISLSEFFDDEMKFPFEYKKIIEELNKMNKDEVDLVYNLILKMNSKN